jgi:hypothetical protein
MTRIFTDGGEMADIDFWNATVGITVGTAAPAPFASAYRYRVGSGDATFRNISALSEGYVRVRAQIESITTAYRLVCFRTGTTTVAYLSIDAIGNIQAVATTIGVLEVSTLVMNINQWYLFEVYFKEANAPNGRFVVYADGTKIIDYTGDTQPAAATTFDNIYFSAGSGAGTDLFLDDLALNDTAGAVDNSYCGDGIVVKIEPDGNGTHNNWHGSDADDVDNYQMCHEFPKDDDTTYVYHDNTSGVQQQFAMSHLSFTGYTILRIYAEARARKTAAAAMTLKLGQLAAGGADVVSAGRALYISAYTRIVGDDSFVNPVDTNPWEEADIDAIEFVAQVT